MTYDDWKCTPPEEEPCPTCDDEGVIEEQMEDGSIVRHPCHVCNRDNRNPRLPEVTT